MRYSKVLNGLIFTLAILTGLGLSEFFCRKNVGEKNVSAGYALFKPNTRTVFRPRQDIMPGILGEARFFTNSYGIRGDEPSERNGYRILVIGGSVAESLYVDQEKSWPSLLQKYLRKGSRFKNIWVGNAGKSGLNSQDHVVQERILLDELPKIDLVVVLAGINDLTVRLSENNNKNLSDADIIKRVFDIIPSEQEKNTQVLKPKSITENCFWCLYKLKNLYDLSKQKNTLDEAGLVYQTWRENRKKSSKIIETLPDLSHSLSEYSENLNTIIDIAQQKSVKIVFITQPSLWKDSMNKEEENLLWLGGIGDFLNISGQPYYSPKVLNQALGEYNKTTLSVCKKRNIDCLDLAGSIPKDASFFYDDAHFNDKGSETAANIVYRFLLSLKL